MTTWLKQSTAVVIQFGPFVDGTDGLTWETGLVSALDHATTGIKISKNGAALAVRNPTVTATTYDAYGNYRVTLDTTDTATLGTLRVQWGDETTALAAWRDFHVLPANVYDALVLGTDYLDANAAQIGGVVPGSATIGTVSTLSGHTAQTGDSFARIGATGSGLTSLLSAVFGNTLFDLIESQRGAHTAKGNVYWVAPVSGNDANPGTRASPCKTVQYVHDNLVTTGNHDLIILVPDQASAVTTMSEAVTLTKRYLQIRGPGRDFIWTRGTAGNTITISGSGTSISGVRIQTAATGNGSGVVISSGADFCAVMDCWFENTRGDGITLTDASNMHILDCVFEECGTGGANGRAIDLVISAGSVDHTFIKDCHISNSLNDGIRLGGTGVEDTVIKDTSIHGSGGYGINIATGTIDTLLCNMCGGQNTSGNLLDNGTATVDSNNWLRDQLDTEHGDGSWTTGGLTGTNTVTVTTETLAAAAIVGAVVNVYDSGNTTLLDQKTTDSSGNAVFAMDDGTYKLRITHANYTFTQPETLTVDEDPEAATYTGTAITVAADADNYEARTLRRQKIRYNSANAADPLTYQAVHAGAKVVPSSATITIYAPGNSTALVSAAAMTISGSIATYSADTTTVASWPVDTGYRAHISYVVGATTHEDDIIFDVVNYILKLNIGVDQLVALDDRISSMEHAGDEDFSEPIEAARDEMQAEVEAKVISDKKLIENMILDSTRLAIPGRYLVLANIFESKNNHEQSDRYRQRYNELMRATLATIKYDKAQDLEESSKIGGIQPMRLRS